MHEAPHQRTCRYGHGTLTDMPGGWFLPGMQPGGADGLMMPDAVNGYLIRLALCPACGYVEFFDYVDQASGD